MTIFAKSDTHVHVHRGEDCIIVDKHGHVFPWYQRLHLNYQLLDDPDLTSHPEQIGKLQILFVLGKTRLFWIIGGAK